MNIWSSTWKRFVSGALVAAMLGGTMPAYALTDDGSPAPDNASTNHTSDSSSDSPTESSAATSSAPASPSNQSSGSENEVSSEDHAASEDHSSGAATETKTDDHTGDSNSTTTDSTTDSTTHFPATETTPANSADKTTESNATGSPNADHADGSAPDAPAADSSTEDSSTVDATTGEQSDGSPSEDNVNDTSADSETGSPASDSTDDISDTSHTAGTSDLPVPSMPDNSDTTTPEEDASSSTAGDDNSPSTETESSASPSQTDSNPSSGSVNRVTSSAQNATTEEEQGNSGTVTWTTDETSGAVWASLSDQTTTSAWQSGTWTNAYKTDIKLSSSTTMGDKGAFIVEYTADAEQPLRLVVTGSKWTTVAPTSQTCTDETKKTFQAVYSAADVTKAVQEAQTKDSENTSDPVNVTAVNFQLVDTPNASPTLAKLTWDPNWTAEGGSDNTPAASTTNEYDLTQIPTATGEGKWASGTAYTDAFAVNGSSYYPPLSQMTLDSLKNATDKGAFVLEYTANTEEVIDLVLNGAAFQKIQPTSQRLAKSSDASGSPQTFQAIYSIADIQAAFAEAAKTNANASLSGETSFTFQRSEAGSSDTKLVKLTWDPDWTSTSIWNTGNITLPYTSGSDTKDCSDNLLSVDAFSMDKTQSGGYFEVQFTYKDESKSTGTLPDVRLAFNNPWIELTGSVAHVKGEIYAAQFAYDAVKTAWVNANASQNPSVTVSDLSGITGIFVKNYGTSPLPSITLNTVSYVGELGTGSSTEDPSPPAEELPWSATNFGERATLQPGTNTDSITGFPITQIQEGGYLEVTYTATAKADIQLTLVDGYTWLESVEAAKEEESGGGAAAQSEGTASTFTEKYTYDAIIAAFEKSKTANKVTALSDIDGIIVKNMGSGSQPTITLTKVAWHGELKTDTPVEPTVNPTWTATNFTGTLASGATTDDILSDDCPVARLQADGYFQLDFTASSPPEQIQFVMDDDWDNTLSGIPVVSGNGYSVQFAYADLLAKWQVKHSEASDLSELKSIKLKNYNSSAGSEPTISFTQFAWYGELKSESGGGDTPVDPEPEPEPTPSTPTWSAGFDSGIIIAASGNSDNIIGECPFDRMQANGTLELAFTSSGTSTDNIQVQFVLGKTNGGWDACLSYVTAERQADGSYIAKCDYKTMLEGWQKVDGNSEATDLSGVKSLLIKNCVGSGGPSITLTQLAWYGELKAPAVSWSKEYNDLTVAAKPVESGVDSMSEELKGDCPVARLQEGGYFELEYTSAAETTAIEFVLRDDWAGITRENVQPTDSSSGSSSSKKYVITFTYEDLLKAWQGSNTGKTDLADVSSLTIKNHGAAIQITKLSWHGELKPEQGGGDEPSGDELLPTTGTPAWSTEEFGDDAALASGGNTDNIVAGKDCPFDRMLSDGFLHLEFTADSKTQIQLVLGGDWGTTLTVDAKQIEGNRYAVQFPYDTLYQKWKEHKANAANLSAMDSLLIKNMDDGTDITLTKLAWYGTLSETPLEDPEEQVAGTNVYDLSGKELRDEWKNGKNWNNAFADNVPLSTVTMTTLHPADASGAFTLTYTADAEQNLLLAVEGSGGFLTVAPTAQICTAVTPQKTFQATYSLADIRKAYAAEGKEAGKIRKFNLQKNAGQDADGKDIEDGIDKTKLALQTLVWDPEWEADPALVFDYGALPKVVPYNWGSITPASNLSPFTVLDTPVAEADKGAFLLHYKADGPVPKLMLVLSGDQKTPVDNTWVTISPVRTTGTVDEGFTAVYLLSDILKSWNWGYDALKSISLTNAGQVDVNVQAQKLTWSGEYDDSESKVDFAPAWDNPAKSGWVCEPWDKSTTVHDGNVPNSEDLMIADVSIGSSDWSYSIFNYGDCDRGDKNLLSVDLYFEKSALDSSSGTRSIGVADTVIPLPSTQWAEVVSIEGIAGRTFYKMPVNIDLSEDTASDINVKFIIQNGTFHGLWGIGDVSLQKNGDGAAIQQSGGAVSFPTSGTETVSSSTANGSQATAQPAKVNLANLTTPVAVEFKSDTAPKLFEQPQLKFKLGRGHEDVNGGTFNKGAIIVTVSLTDPKGQKCSYTFALDKDFKRVPLEQTKQRSPFAARMTSGIVPLGNTLSMLEQTRQRSLFTARTTGGILPLSDTPEVQELTDADVTCDVTPSADGKTADVVVTYRSKVVDKVQSVGLAVQGDGDCDFNDVLKVEDLILTNGTTSVLSPSDGSDNSQPPTFAEGALSWVGKLPYTWDFSQDSLFGWGYAKGWESHYSGAKTTTVRNANGMMQVNVDYSKDKEQGWSQMALTLYTDYGSVNLKGANHLSLCFLYEPEKMDGAIKLRLGSWDTGIDADGVIDEESAEEVEIDGVTYKKVKVDFVFNKVKKSFTKQLALMLIGVNTSYQGSLYITDMTIDDQAPDPYIDAKVQAKTTTTVRSTDAELVVNGAAQPYATEVKLADPNADAATVRLYQYLKAVGESDAALFGHMEDTVLKAGLSSLSNSDTKDLTGSLAAINGLDCGGLFAGFADKYRSQHPESGPLPAGTEGDIKAAALLSNDAIAEGAITTLSIHMPNFAYAELVNPDAEKTYNRYSYPVDSYNLTGDCMINILPGGKFNGAFTAFLDLIAEYAGQVDGPILFRPLHENTGSWFWWGKAFCDPETYKSVYKYTVEYLRDTKGIHNLLYVYGPGSEAATLEDYGERYPGDEYVDMIGFDTYDDATSPEFTANFMQNLEKSVKLTDAFAKQHGKLFAVTEIGINTLQDKTEEQIDKAWFDTVLNIITKPEYDCAYYMVWSNYSKTSFYTPFAADIENGKPHGHWLMDPFISFYNRADSIFANDQAKAIRQEVTAPAVAPWEATGYITSPVGGSRVLEPTTITAQLSQDDMDVTLAVANESGETKLPTTVEGRTASAQIPADVLEALGHTVDGKVTLYQGDKPLAQYGVVFNIPEPVRDPLVVDDFESYYGNQELLIGSWSTNMSSGSTFNVSLSNASGEAQDGYALRIDYTEPSGGWAGATISKETDWSQCDALQFWTIPDGKQQKMVIQINAGGKTYETYLNLFDDYNAQAGKPVLVTLPFSQIEEQNTQVKSFRENSASVTGFGLWINAIDNAAMQNGQVSGTIWYDNIKAVKSDADAITIVPADAAN